MAVSPLDLLQMARQLMSEEKEINYRSAANRAYYCAFHACTFVAASLPQSSNRRGGPHEKLIAKLKNHPVRRPSRARDNSIRALGNFLDNGKALRVEADYRIGGEFNRNKAEELILTAVRIGEIITEIERN